MGHDERVKAAMKGELVSFLVATAREFATRRARRAADDDTPLPFGRSWGEVRVVGGNESVRLGNPTAVALASGGARVILSARREDVLKEAAAECVAIL